MVYLWSAATVRYMAPYNESPYNATTKLKMTIKSDLSGLTMVVTDPSGLKKVNIFKNKQLAPTVELLDYILKDLEERKIQSKVKKRQVY